MCLSRYRLAYSFPFLGLRCPDSHILGLVCVHRRLEYCVAHAQLLVVAIFPFFVQKQIYFPTADQRVESIGPAVPMLYEGVDILAHGYLLGSKEGCIRESYAVIAVILKNVEDRPSARRCLAA